MLTQTARKLVEFGVKGRLELLLKKSTSLQPQLLYGGVIPPPTEVVSGGKVKLTYLRDRFPEQGLNGNILYFVTSALPKGAVEWAKTCKKKGIKVVINQNGIAFPAWTTEAECQRINKRNRDLLALADYVFFQSEFCLEGVKQLVWRDGDKPKHEILCNPIDSKRFAYNEKAILNDEIRILVTGSHHNAARVELPIDAVDILRRENKLNVKLLIAGSLRWKNGDAQIKEKIINLGLEHHVSVTGPYLQKDAPQIYHSSHILLHLQDKDASPTVPLEALACGLKVIAPKSGGLPELIADRLGTLLPVQEGWESYHLPTVDQLVHAIEQAVTSPPNSQKDTKQWIDRFAVDHWMNRHTLIFESLLRG